MNQQQRRRIGGTDTNPVYAVEESTRDGPVTKYVVGETGVAFDTREAAESAAQELDGLNR